MPIRFNYLYRDAGNYKQYGHLIFSNSNNLTLREVEDRIRAALIDGEFFNARQWGLPELRGFEWDDDLDHEWHEYVSVEYVEEGTIEGSAIEEFLGGIVIGRQSASHRFEVSK